MLSMSDRVGYLSRDNNIKALLEDKGSDFIEKISKVNTESALQYIEIATLIKKMPFPEVSKVHPFLTKVSEPRPFSWQGLFQTSGMRDSLIFQQPQLLTQKSCLIFFLRTKPAKNPAEAMKTPNTTMSGQSDHDLLQFLL